MTTAHLPRVLLVDDDERLLNGLQRLLRRRFELTLANSPAAVLEHARTERFAVIVSDYRMPTMDGITLLAHVRDIAPETVRVLLTGHADVGAAIAAVNEGNVFRFLSKPCPPEVMIRALNDAVAQHELIVAERVLLEQTLHGSVAALVDVLALVQPAAFGRASRVKRLVGELAEQLSLPDRWALEVAAMLSQIGTIALPPALVERLGTPRAVTEEERTAAAEIPRHAARIIEAIPRLGGVRDILNRVGHRAVPRVGHPPDGADLLTAALDFDELGSCGLSPAEAVGRLRGRRDWYDDRIVGALALRYAVEMADPVFEVPLGMVSVGAIFADDVRTAEGILLISRGQEATPGLVSRIENFWAELTLAGPVRIRRPAGPVAGESELDGSQAPSEGRRSPAGGVEAEGAGGRRMPGP